MVLNFQLGLNHDSILLPNRKGTYSFLERKPLAWGWSVKQMLLGHLVPLLNKTFVKTSNWEKSMLLNCTHIINCSTGAGNPMETWWILEIRTLIRDMCTCWGYPNYGYLNQDPLCNQMTNNTQTWFICGIPTSHHLDSRLEWNRKIRAT